jgi:hypothetical protein
VYIAFTAYQYHAAPEHILDVGVRSARSTGEFNVTVEFEPWISYATVGVLLHGSGIGRPHDRRRRFLASHASCVYVTGMYLRLSLLRLHSVTGMCARCRRVNARRGVAYPLTGVSHPLTACRVLLWLARDRR